MLFEANIKRTLALSLALLLSTPFVAIAGAAGPGADAWVQEAPEPLVLRLEKRLGADSWLSAQTVDSSASPLLAPRAASPSADAWVQEAPEPLVLRLEKRLGADSWLSAQTVDSSASPLLAPRAASPSADGEVVLPRTYGFSKGAMLPLVGAAGDSISTHIGLQQAHVLERNGLINTSPAGLVGLFVIKAGVIYALDQQPQHVRKPALKMTAGLWNGLVANNLLVAAGASNPVSILAGVAYGIYMYHREHDILEREEAAARGQTDPVW